MSNFWNGKRVFITGINGFIGGMLVETLIKLGANVHGLIRNQSEQSYLYYEGLSEKVTLIQGDLTDLLLLKRIMAEEQIQVVFHLAAQVEVGLACSNPFVTFETNIRGTYCLLEAIRENGLYIESVVVASTDKSYGSYGPDKMPYKEDYPLIPVFPYDVSKACADMIARSYTTDIFSLPIVVTRFSNIYGPGQLNFSAIIPDTIRSALGYSKFVPRSNGSHIRDFLYVGDVAELYLRIGEQLSKRKEIAAEVFNAGTNHPQKIRDVIKIVYETIENFEDLEQVELQFANKKAPGEIDCQFMDYAKVNQYFEWSPKTTFETGIQKTILWYKKYLQSTIVHPKD
jgi:CDP-glucose 4,6-dehydratase